MSDLIREHDPFSGHEPPSAAEEPIEVSKAPEKPSQTAEQAEKPKQQRRGRRPRRVPTASEVAASARKARR